MMDYNNKRQQKDKRSFKQSAFLFLSFLTVTIFAATIAVNINQNYTGIEGVDAQTLNVNGFHRQYDAGDVLHVTWGNDVETANLLLCVVCTGQFVELGNDSEDPELVAAVKARATYEANRGFFQGLLDWILGNDGGFGGGDGSGGGYSSGVVVGNLQLASPAARPTGVVTMEEWRETP